MTRPPSDLSELSELGLESTYSDQLPELAMEWEADAAPAPELVAANRGLATQLGIDPDSLVTDAAVARLAGVVPAGGPPGVALAYAGHQFGNYSPRLGDGRALLLGELVDPDGKRCDLHLKGSGRTPFARGGDGKAALGSMLREFLFAEAMHALGVPTMRALAVVTTGETVRRESLLPGAILTRVGASHIRVGTFQFAAATGEVHLVRRLADHAIERHHPGAAAAERPYLALLELVADAQAQLVAKWMLLGFIHGVLNTDNVTLSAETIDYGPCAFMDAHDPRCVFSSIDHGGRYAYGNQPAITVWNLARLAETLLPLISEDSDEAVELATAALEAFSGIHQAHWARGMAAKLGLGGSGSTPAPSSDPADDGATAGGATGDGASGDGASPEVALFEDFFALLQANQVDHTSAFLAMTSAADGDDKPVHELVADHGALDAWLARWEALRPPVGPERDAARVQMGQVNPTFIPRNHLVDAAIRAADAGDLTLFSELFAVVTRPFDDRGSADPKFSEPGSPEFTAGFKTFCGT